MFDGLVGAITTFAHVFVDHLGWFCFIWIAARLLGLNGSRPIKIKAEIEL